MLVFNGTEIEKVIYNGVELDKLIYNGTTVFESTPFVPDPVLENNTWGNIKIAFNRGIAPSGWVGQTKSFTDTQGTVYNVRLVNNNQGSVGTFETVNTVSTLPPGQNWYNTSTWIRTDTTGLLKAEYDKLPTEIKSIIRPNAVYYQNGTTSSSIAVLSNQNLWIPCAHNYGISQPQGLDAEGDVFQYYQTHSSESDRIKYKIGTTTANKWWTRSHYNNAKATYIQIQTTGAASNISGSSTLSGPGVAWCFNV